MIDFFTSVFASQREGEREGQGEREREGGRERGKGERGGEKESSRTRAFPTLQLCLNSSPTRLHTHVVYNYYSQLYSYWGYKPWTAILHVYAYLGVYFVIIIVTMFILNVRLPLLSTQRDVA